MTHDLPGLLPGLEVVRKDFPILGRVLADGFPLVYLDSANTSQKPQVVIDAMVDHLERHNANVSRAVHQLGAESTEAYEAARLCALNALAAAAAETGGLDRIDRVVKVTGFVASAPGFNGQPGVLNGTSELLGEVFGEAGLHARSAVGVAELPLDAPVEVEIVVVSDPAGP